MNWIKVDQENKPENLMPVIVYVENAHGNPKATRRLRAMYAERYSLPLDENSDGGEENPEDGEYYCVEGWYENNEFEDVHWFIDGDVTNWQPLPPKPTTEAEQITETG